MHAIFGALPGHEEPVGGIAAGFRRLWAGTPAEEGRAMQLNLVLHFGMLTEPEDALRQFRTAVAFAQRHPGRVVVLCPEGDPAARDVFRAKIYGECFLGRSGRDTRCCEFVILAYPAGSHDYLQNQVSVCLSTDLPIYYWAHRFSSNARLAAYRYLLTRARRVLIDSAVVSPDAASFPWPNAAAVRDLAYTRTRPLRQAFGQFLSRYAPADIVAGLERIELRHQAVWGAEAVALAGWLRRGLARCGANLEALTCDVRPADDAHSLSLSFRYADARRHFSWSADLASGQAEIRGDLGQGLATLRVGARLLDPAEALSEAIFH